MKIWGVTEAEVLDMAADGGEGADGEDLAGMAELSRRHSPALVAQAGEVVQARLCCLSGQDGFAGEVRRVYLARLLERHAATGELPKPGHDMAAMPRRAGWNPLSPREVAQGTATLASLPPVYARILRTINDPRSSSQHIAQAISCDVGLSARLLALVNSPFYGLSHAVDSLDRAVAVVGSRQLLELAVGVCLVTSFQNIPSALFDMRAFWEHSLACGIVARLLASLRGDRREDRAFTAGLLHDVGRLVMLRQYPARCLEALAQARCRQEPLCKVEEEFWGFDHAALAGVLLEGWGLPASLIQAVAGHHQPLANRGNGVEEHRFFACLLHVADVLAHLLHTGDLHSSGGWLAPPCDNAAWEALGLEMGAISTTLRAAEAQLGQVLAIFLPPKQAEKRTTRAA